MQQDAQTRNVQPGGICQGHVTALRPLHCGAVLESPAEAASALAPGDTCLGLHKRTHAGRILSQPRNGPGSRPRVSQGLFLWSLGGCSGVCSPGNWNLENGKSGGGEGQG